MSGPLGGNPGWQRVTGKGQRRMLTRGMRVGSYVLISYKCPKKPGRQQEDDFFEYEGTIVDKRIGGQDRESYVELKDCLKIDGGRVVGRETSKRLIDAFIDDCRVVEKRAVAPEIEVPGVVAATGSNDAAAAAAMGCFGMMPMMGMMTPMGMMPMMGLVPGMPMMGMIPGAMPMMGMAGLSGASTTGSMDAGCACGAGGMGTGRGVLGGAYGCGCSSGCGDRRCEGSGNRLEGACGGHSSGGPIGSLQEAFRETAASRRDRSRSQERRRR